MKKILLITILVLSSVAFAAETLPTMNAAELAKYNGKNSQKAYIAYKGKVYDVTNVKKWKDGEHEGNKAGTDLTPLLAKAPHGDKIIEKLHLKPVANYVAN